MLNGPHSLIPRFNGTLPLTTGLKGSFTFTLSSIKIKSPFRLMAMPNEPFPITYELNEMLPLTVGSK